MTLQDLANIGEIIGGVVVVISLLYVALQVRQNSDVLERTVQSIRTQAFQHISENFNFYRQLLIDPDVSAIFIKGCNDYSSLDSFEKLRFNMVASSYIWTSYQYFFINQGEGLIGNLNDRVYADMFKHPGFREWYSDYQHTLPGDYVNFLSDVESNLGGQVFQPGELSNLFQGKIN